MAPWTGWTKLPPRKTGSGEDFGYVEFYAGIGTVLMGRATYEQILTFDVDYPYSGTAGYVFLPHPGRPAGRKGGVH